MSREKDTISVLIPAYNECPWLLACVDLLLAQTVKPLEIISRRGSVAVRFWPLALGLFASKFVETSYLAFRWGRGNRVRFCALAPGVLFGLLFWNVGFLSGLRAPIPPLDGKRFPDTSGDGPGPGTPGCSVAKGKL